MTTARGRGGGRCKGGVATAMPRPPQTVVTLAWKSPPDPLVVQGRFPVSRPSNSSERHRL
eukprot:3456014-Karenia_brevis.AAC.1